MSTSHPQTQSETPFHPKAIIFDLLTALLDSWTTWDASIPIPISTPNITGRTWRKEYLNLTYTCGSYVPYESLVLQSALNVGLPSSVADTLLSKFDEIKPWDEVPHILARLSTQSPPVKLGVVTNCSTELGHRAVRNLERIVQTSTNATKFKFDGVITAEEVGYYKPDPRPYQAMLDKLGVEGDEALFVAGSSGDIPGAMGVGMRVAWNNHVGLERRSVEVPWSEGRELGEALGGVLRE